MKTKNKCELSQADGNVILTVNKEVVFQKPKTPQTLSLASMLYFAYKYDLRLIKEGCHES